MDGAAIGGLISGFSLRVTKIIRVLDFIVKGGRCRLPAENDDEAWRTLLGPRIPPANPVAIITIIRIVKGLHQPEALQSMTAEEDPNRLRRGTDSQSPPTRRPRPVSRSYAMSHTGAPGGLVSSLNPLHQSGEFDRVREIFLEAANELRFEEYEGKSCRFTLHEDRSPPWELSRRLRPQS